MPNCTNDWSGVIAVIAFQIPIVIGIFGTWMTSRINAEKVKGQTAVVTQKVDSLTTLVIDGFKSPPRPAPTPAPNVDISPPGLEGEPGII